ncbi:hypothetical protein CTI12_AA174000 [Artemisia annua]|uniref:Uncharacterized protein n=1 Tax=Artemisia annua TaxID=35608 RepID=A0A2U1PA60_ARTAN|nr:hypothetical protein CTI12_AA174000 [Artemisia annua]
MPPRKDVSSSDEMSSNANDQLNQLINITTNSANNQATLNTQIEALVQATTNLNTKLDAQTENTARLINHVARLADRFNSESDEEGPGRHHFNLNQPPPWLNEIKHYYKDHPTGIEFIQQITSNPAAFPHHLYKDGLVYVNGKILVPPIGNKHVSFIALIARFPFVIYHQILDMAEYFVYFSHIATLSLQAMPAEQDALRFPLLWTHL